MAAAGVTALLALAVTVASLGWLHVEPTGLSPVRNAVSQYGITPFRIGYRVATIAFAAAGIALAAGVGVVARTGSAVAVALSGPADAPGSGRAATSGWYRPACRPSPITRRPAWHCPRPAR